TPKPLKKLMATVRITILKNGPLKVEGEIILESPDGTQEKKEKVTYLCRCGYSEKKPYCDGTHSKKNFVG
ncbi:MAG: CDGSH iron-sulfur domain-containing protein, partial [Bacteroidia bacterium]